ncbi:hypothetical protein ACJ73_08056 [Blastomyces percursus]|uniref:Uncharacterized protein n=1 Tax=Blastomyces percursus TaxID=1658174 RepID=A0A1J9PW88_9EURO|nr:hypothetical protein ACJ73_08056 [Blastomyces percursus]
MQPKFHELDSISHITFHLRDDDQDTLKTLKAKMLELTTQLSVLEKLEPVATLIRSREPLPVRKLSFNIKKLSDSNLKTDSRGESRWARLQSLGCEAAVFCMVTFNGLSTLAGEEFEWLLGNASNGTGTKATKHTSLSRKYEPPRAASDFQCSNVNINLGYHMLEFQTRDTNERDTPEEEPATKRIRIDHAEEETCEAELQACASFGMENERRTPPSNDGKREMKYMFTNAPASAISTLSEPFKQAVENSRLWKWERSHGLGQTGCLASLFPKDVMQDVSFTIWCGHDDGYRLNSVFGMRREITS